MATGGNAIRGTRVGAGPMGEQDHGHHADRVAVSYWDALGNETVRYFAAGIADEEIPEVIDSPTQVFRRARQGEPAGARSRALQNPPRVCEGRRTEEEADALLDDALHQLRERRGQA